MKVVVMKGTRKGNTEDGNIQVRGVIGRGE